VLAVMTHAMSAACIPNSSAIAGPMKAMDWVSKPSRSAMAKHSETTPQRRTFIGLSLMTVWTSIVGADAIDVPPSIGAAGRPPLIGTCVVGVRHVCSVQQKVQRWLVDSAQPGGGWTV
jgi:hypothetical protein